jgi:hypothetical protein
MAHITSMLHRIQQKSEVTSSMCLLALFVQMQHNNFLTAAGRPWLAAHSWRLWKMQQSKYVQHANHISKLSHTPSALMVSHWHPSRHLAGVSSNSRRLSATAPPDAAFDCAAGASTSLCQISSQHDGPAACTLCLNSCVPEYAGKPIPAPLPDRRPLPAGVFTDQQAVLQAEGGTMYW